jgi:hypothetical protein
VGNERVDARGFHGCELEEAEEYQDRDQAEPEEEVRDLIDERGEWAFGETTDE